MAIRTLSICTGGAGLELALDIACPGLFRPVCYCECEAYAVETLIDKIAAGCLPDAPVWDNVRTLCDAEVGRVVGRVDAIVGGYPCQPFSHAGRRDGADDPRHLWPAIREAIGVYQPGVCFFENVSGHLSLGAREVFGDLESLDEQFQRQMARVR